MKNYKWFIALMIMAIVLGIFVFTWNTTINLLNTLDILDHTAHGILICGGNVLGILCCTLFALAFGLGALRMESGRKERLPLLLLALGEVGCIIGDFGWLIYNIVFFNSGYSEAMISSSIALQALYHIMVAIFIIAAIWLAVVNKSTLMRIGAALFVIGKTMLAVVSLFALPIIMSYINDFDNERWYLRMIYPLTMGVWHFVVNLCLYVPIIVMAHKAGKACAA